MQISKEYRFEASHILPRHPGKCSRLHGHSYHVRVELEGKLNPDTCFVLDYARLDALVKPVVDFMDHRHLNFLIEYPSAENITIFLATLLQRLVVVPFVRRLRISVSETEKTLAVWDSLNPSDVHAGNNPSIFQWGAPRIEPHGEELLFGPVHIGQSEYLALMSQFADLRRQVQNGINELRREWQQELLKAGVQPDGGTVTGGGQ